MATAPLGCPVGSGSFSLSRPLYGIVVRKMSLSQRPGSVLLCVLLEKPLCSTQAQRPRVICSSFCISAHLSLWPARCGHQSPHGIPPWQAPEPDLASEGGGPALQERAGKEKMMRKRPSSFPDPCSFSIGGPQNAAPSALGREPCHSQDELGRPAGPGMRGHCVWGVVRLTLSHKCESASGL